jgi:hypothetical protein
MVPAKLCQTLLQNDSCPMCRRQFLQQQSSSQTTDELDQRRAEVDAQAAVNHLREVGQFMRRRGELLRNMGPLEARIQYLTGNDSIEDNGDGPSLNSGMYS